MVSKPLPTAKSGLPSVFVQPVQTDFYIFKFLKEKIVHDMWKLYETEVSVSPNEVFLEHCHTCLLASILQWQSSAIVITLTAQILEYLLCNPLQNKVCQSFIYNSKIIQSSNTSSNQRFPRSTSYIVFHYICYIF